MNTHLLSLADFSKEELQSLIDRARVLKAERQQGIRHQQLAGRTICLLFEKPSTRTRVSFEAAMYSLGGQVIFMSAKESQLGRGEPLKDTARVLSRYVDAIVVRTFGQEVVEELARFATVPVINALTDLHHPCQVLSDLMTVLEQKGAVDQARTAWIGDGNNMANALLHGCAKVGMHITVATPAGYAPDKRIIAEAQEAAAASGAKIVITNNPMEAATGADVLYTDVWASMGQESEAAKRRKDFAAYQVNSQLLAVAPPKAVVMHCLPAHRGEEITDAVMEGPQSVVFDQAENRLHVQKAILSLVMGDNQSQ